VTPSVIDKMILQIDELRDGEAFQDLKLMLCFGC